MTPTTRKKEPEAGTRDRLLTAALTLFNEKGYAAASVRELVQAAGVTKPVLYYYFGSKEGIYLELMESSRGIFESLVARIVSLDGFAQQRIVQFCGDLFDISLEKLAQVRLIYAIYYGPPQGAPQSDLEAYFTRMMEVIRHMVDEGVASGEFAENGAGDATRAIVALLTSAIDEQLCRRESRLDRDGMVRMLNLLMRGMANG